MAAKYVNELFRFESSSFYKNLAIYLIDKRKDLWNAKNCTFFHDEAKGNERHS